MEHFDPASIQIELPSANGPRKSLTDFGARAEASFCNTAAFRAALDFARENPGTVLSLPQGVYHFYSAPDGL